MKKFAKFEIEIFLAMPNSKLCTYEFSAQYLYFCGQGKPSNFTTVIEAKRQKIGPDREFLGQIFKLFVGTDTPKQH